jgi:YHS domain-containing protein
MDTRVFLLSIGLAAVTTVGNTAAGQHEGHQAGTAPSVAQVTECRQAQPVITGLLNAALKRLEDARLTNSVAAMRDAADDVQAALVDMRTQLAPCSVMQAAATEAPAGQAAAPARAGTPAAAGTRAAGKSSAAPAPAAPHGGHAVPVAPAATSRTPAATPARPAASPQRAAPPTAADSHAGHAADAPPAPPTNIAELQCSNAVDPKTAPRMLYQGRMYYFCTEASRAEFAKDPATFVTAPPQAAPAHAH